LFSAKTAHILEKSDHPLGIIVDPAGVIRFIGVLPSAAFNGEFMEKLITQIVECILRLLRAIHNPI
jgi:hypothetical protein